MFNKDIWSGPSIVVTLALVIFLTAVIFRYIFPKPVAESSESNGGLTVIVNSESNDKRVYHGAQHLGVDNGSVRFYYQGKEVIVLSGVVEVIK